MEEVLGEALELSLEDTLVIHSKGVLFKEVLFNNLSQGAQSHSTQAINTQEGVYQAVYLFRTTVAAQPFSILTQVLELSLKKRYVVSLMAIRIRVCQIATLRVTSR